MRAIVLGLCLSGCTVGSAAVLPRPWDGGCGEPVPLVLGPDRERISCPVPLDLPPPRTDRARAAIAALEAMNAELCEEERIRISWLDERAWARERDADWDREPGQLGVHIGSGGVDRLWPTPHEHYDACTLEARASEWLARHRAIFLVDDPEVTLVVVTTDARRAYAREEWRGVRVAMGQLVMEWNEGLARFDEVSGIVLPRSMMPATDVPAIDGDAAREVAYGAAGARAETELVVWGYPGDISGIRLAWIVASPYVEGEGTVVDAIAGTIRWRIENPRIR